MCRNAALARRRAHRREELLQSTESALGEIRDAVGRNTLQGADRIGIRVGERISQHRMKKHFTCEITDRSFTFRRNRQSILAEQALDGLYVIRTSLSKRQASAADCVRGYKSLCAVERAFRTLKTTHLQVHPIHHRLTDRVIAHLFLCMLAYHVEWHMREAWRPITFADSELRDEAPGPDPVAPARRSASAERKAHTGLLEDGTAAHSFDTLMQYLATITRNRCRVEGTGVTFDTTTQPDSLQDTALSLLDDIRKLARKSE